MLNQKQLKEKEIIKLKQLLEQFKVERKRIEVLNYNTLNGKDKGGESVEKTKK